MNAAPKRDHQPAAGGHSDAADGAGHRVGRQVVRPGIERVNAGCQDIDKPEQAAAGIPDWALADGQIEIDASLDGFFKVDRSHLVDIPPPCAFQLL